ncbi:hypothetical protein Ddye_017992 [Dipteronia dyeriana]|uniref:Uncharacterized protein n=1 Tax=Dipteronia dyeriana TaxID=168575 RepID=A0AAD9UAA1_9ROSI|nr:hypothetical protein Ddye_017992 [Dipteronia dyeriana]
MPTVNPLVAVVAAKPPRRRRPSRNEDAWPTSLTKRGRVASFVVHAVLRLLPAAVLRHHRTVRRHPFFCFRLQG